jgi:hypothetical protein
MTFLKLEQHFNPAGIEIEQGWRGKPGNRQRKKTSNPT